VTTPHAQRHVCPACGEDRLTEFDGVTLLWACAVCSETWRNGPGRRVPARPAQRVLPRTRESLDFDRVELPPPGGRGARGHR
jgi:ribosomal protein L37AE/L43A